MNKYHQLLKKQMEQFFQEVIIAQCTKPQEYHKKLFVKFIVRSNAPEGFPVEAVTKSIIENNKIVQFGTIVLKSTAFSNFSYNNAQFELTKILINDKHYNIKVKFADVVTVAVPEDGFCVDLSSCLNDNAIYDGDFASKTNSKKNGKNSKIITVNFDSSKQSPSK